MTKYILNSNIYDRNTDSLIIMSRFVFLADQSFLGNKLSPEVFFFCKPSFNSCI